jgi:hypothetical protein
VLQCVKHYFKEWEDEWKEKESMDDAIFISDNNTQSEASTSESSGGVMMSRSKRKGGARKGRTATASKTKESYEKYIVQIKNVRKSEYTKLWDKRLKEEAAAQIEKEFLQQMELNTAEANENDADENHDNDGDPPTGIVDFAASYIENEWSDLLVDLS